MAHREGRHSSAKERANDTLDVRSDVREPAGRRIYDHTDLTDQLEVVKKVQEHAGKRRLVAQSRSLQVIEK